MSAEFKDIVKVASIYVTTIIGAGFASGQEIIKFFSSYYKGGFYGIILAGILFSLIGVIVLNKVYSERMKQYDEFIFPTLGWLGGWIMEVVVIVFMFCLFCIMVAGLGNILTGKFGVSFGLGIVLMTVVILGVMLTDIRGIVNLSAVITPLLVAGIIAVGIYIIYVNGDTQVFSRWGAASLTDNWLVSSLVYVSYNSIMSVVVLCKLLPYLKSKKTVVAGGLLGGIMLMFVALVLNLALFMFYPDRLEGELPVLALVEKYSSLIGGVYTLIISLAMFTSAVTAGYFLVDRLGNRLKMNAKYLAAIFCMLGIPIASMGFSNLITTIYPIFGYIGMFMLCIILFEGVKMFTGRAGGKK